MNKAELMDALKEKLCGLPEDELKKSLYFYSEMIDDRMEDGLSEEEAVAAIGDVKTISDSILEDVPLKKLVGEKVKSAKPSRGLRPWEIVLIVLGSPIWFPVGFAFSIVFIVLAFVFYLVYWLIILVFYLVDLCIGVSGVAAVAVGALAIAKGIPGWGLLLIGGGLFCTGFAIAFFFLCNLVAKGIIKLSKVILRGFKSLFLRKKKEKPEE